MNYTEIVQAVKAYTENYDSSFIDNIPVFVKQVEQRVYNTVQIPALRRNQTGLVTASNKYLSSPPDFLSAYSLAVIENYGEATEAYTYLLNKDVNYIREAYPTPADTGLPQYYAIFGPTVVDNQATTDLSFILGPTPDAVYYVELHYYYYPPTIVQGTIASINLLSAGSLYVDGVYTNVPLVNVSGSNAGASATADVRIQGGSVSSVSIVNPGVQYLVDDVFTVSQLNLGGAGSDFFGSVASVENTTGTSWLGDNFDPVLLYGTLREAYLFMKGEVDIIQNVEAKYNEALAQLKRLGDGLERQDAYRSGQARVQVT